MGLFDIIRGKKEQPDSKLREFLLQNGFAAASLQNPEKDNTICIGNSVLLDVQKPGRYRLGISPNPDSMNIVVGARFDKAGSYMLEPIFIRKIHEVDTLFGPAREYENLQVSLRVARLGTKQSYERAKELAIHSDKFEAAALFRDLALSGRDEPADIFGKDKEKSKWPKFAGLAAAATVVLASYLIYQNNKQTEKIDQSSRKLDYLVESSIADHAKYNSILIPNKYAMQHFLAKEYDTLAKKEVALSPFTEVETGVKYYPPVHEEKEGTYNWYLIAKEAHFNYLENEHSGEIEASKDFMSTLRRFNLENFFNQIRREIRSKRDDKKGVEILREKRFREEAIPIEDRLLLEYSLPAKVKIERTQAGPASNGQIAGSQSIAMKIGDATIEYVKTSFYVKTGEEPVSKNPMYITDKNQKPIFTVHGTLNLDDKTSVRFGRDGFRGVDVFDFGRLNFHEDSDWPSRNKELLNRGRKAYNDFRDKYDLSKFYKVAEEWAK